MSKLTKEEFFTHLDGLTVLELADYVKEFETRYGISAAAAVPVAAAAPAAEAKAEEAKTEFAVVLKNAGEKDQRDQDRSGDHRPRTQGSEGSGRRRAQDGQGGLVQGRCRSHEEKFEEVGAQVELQ